MLLILFLIGSSSCKNQNHMLFLQLLYCTKQTGASWGGWFAIHYYLTAVQKKWEPHSTRFIRNNSARLLLISIISHILFTFELPSDPQIGLRNLLRDSLQRLANEDLLQVAAGCHQNSIYYIKLWLQRIMFVYPKLWWPNILQIKLLKIYPSPKL